MKKLRIGVAGLGRAFSLMAPAFRDPRVELVAAADPRPEALGKFQQEFRGRTFPSVEAMCADPGIDLVYVATPHELHAPHACAALSAGKSALVEKPMALTLEDGRRMIHAARHTGAQLVVGHSHSFDAPILRTKELIDSQSFGRLRMITGLYFTDFVYRPRRPGELAAALQNQAAHHVDIARLLAGGRVRSVRAFTGDWDRARPANGAYSCLLGFDNGVSATLTYSGYAHFDSDELMGGIGELGQRKQPSVKQKPGADEIAVKNSRNYGGPQFKELERVAHEHFGMLIASCEKADLRPLPGGVMIYAEAERRLDALPPPRIPRVEVIDEIYAAVVEGKAPLHSGESALATLQVCLAILDSARQGKEILL
jgi:phthalate 4,5-cis-dihydrodiol dehydrogenase